MKPCGPLAYGRGFNRKNLLFGFSAAVGLSVLVVGAKLLWPEALFRDESAVRLFGGSVGFWFGVLTLVHGAMHLGFAVLYEHARHAFEQADYERARRLLLPFAVKGNEHYDEEGEAHRALLTALQHLRREEEAARVQKRCQQLGFLC